jgi:hypothetical protein
VELSFYETDFAEKGMTEERLESRTDASLAEVFQIVTPRLVAFFRARGCKYMEAEALAQKVTCELTGRVQEALRGPRSHDGLDPAVIRIGDLKLDLARRLLLRGDEEIPLTPKEFDLLSLLMNVRILRKKIEKVPSNPEYIVSAPWVGYRFASRRIQERLNLNKLDPTIALLPRSYR